MSDRWSIPVQLLKSMTTSREFSNWMWYIRWETRRKAETIERQEYYLAQIAYEVYNAFRTKRRGKIKDFILKFTTTSEGDKKVSAPVEDGEQRMARSKAAWLGGIMGAYNRKASVPSKSNKFGNRANRPNRRSRRQR